MNPKKLCPNCTEGRLKSWHELNDEEKEVVKRLPGAIDTPPAEREALYIWCTRCWHEQTQKDLEA